MIERAYNIKNKDMKINILEVKNISMETKINKKPKNYIEVDKELIKHIQQELEVEE